MSTLMLPELEETVGHEWDFQSWAAIRNCGSEYEIARATVDSAALSLTQKKHNHKLSLVNDGIKIVLKEGSPSFSLVCADYTNRPQEGRLESEIAADYLLNNEGKIYVRQEHIRSLVKNDELVYPDFLEPLTGTHILPLLYSLVKAYGTKFFLELDDELSSSRIVKVRRYNPEPKVSFNIGR